MLIIAGHVTVDPARRDEYVAAFADLVRRAREAPGCLRVAITADSLEPDRVNNLEVWESDETLDAWRAVSNPPAIDIEIRTDDVLRYDVSGTRPPFD